MHARFLQLVSNYIPKATTKMKLYPSRSLTMILPIVALVNVEAWAQPMLLHARTDTPSLSRQDFAAFLQTFDSVLLSQNLRGLVKAAKDYCAGCTSKSRIWCRRIDDHVSHEACSEVRELQVHHAQMWTVAHSLRTQYVRWRNPIKPASDEIWAPPPKAPTPDPYYFLDILKGLCFWPRPRDGSDHRSFRGIESVLSETSRISDTTTDSLVHKIQNAGHTFSVGLDNLCIVAYPGLYLHDVLGKPSGAGPAGPSDSEQQSQTPATDAYHHD